MQHLQVGEILNIITNFNYIVGDLNLNHKDRGHCSTRYLQQLVS